MKKHIKILLIISISLLLITGCGILLGRIIYRLKNTKSESYRTSGVITNKDTYVTVTYIPHTVGKNSWMQPNYTTNYKTEVRLDSGIIFTDTTRKTYNEHTVGDTVSVVVTEYYFEDERVYTNYNVAPDEIK